MIGFCDRKERHILKVPKGKVCVKRTCLNVLENRVREFQLIVPNAKWICSPVLTLSKCQLEVWSGNPIVAKRRKFKFRFIFGSGRVKQFHAAQRNNHYLQLNLTCHSQNGRSAHQPRFCWPMAGNWPRVWYATIFFPMNMAFWHLKLAVCHTENCRLILLSSLWIRKIVLLQGWGEENDDSVFIKAVKKRVQWWLPR